MWERLVGCPAAARILLPYCGYSILFSQVAKLAAVREEFCSQLRRVPGKKHSIAGYSTRYWTRWCVRDANKRCLFDPITRYHHSNNTGERQFEQRADESDWV
jgi:hypothetical protein